MRLVETRKEEEEASWLERTSGGSDISDTQTEAAVYVVCSFERKDFLKRRTYKKQRRWEACFDFHHYVSMLFCPTSFCVSPQVVVNL